MPEFKLGSRFRRRRRDSLLLVPEFEVVGGRVDLGEEHFDDELRALLDLAEALLEDLPRQLFPFLEHTRTLVQRLRALDHAVEQLNDVDSVQHDAHLLLEGHAVEVAVRSLELRVVEVVVVLRESDKCVYDALGHEPSRETGEVELPLLRYPLGIRLVVLGLITFIYGILLVALGSLGGLLRLGALDVVRALVVSNPRVEVVGVFLAVGEFAGGVVDDGLEVAGIVVVKVVKVVKSLR